MGVWKFKNFTVTNLKVIITNQTYEKMQQWPAVNFNPYIMITCPCNEHPLTPHFYMLKLGFIWYNVFFLFLL